MYILFDKDSNKEVLRYFVEVPQSLKESYNIVEVKEVPEKEGFIERATYNKGKVVWEYEEILEKV